MLQNTCQYIVYYIVAKLLGVVKHLTKTWKPNQDHPRPFPGGRCLPECSGGWGCLAWVILRNSRNPFRTLQQGLQKSGEFQGLVFGPFGLRAFSVSRIPSNVTAGSKNGPIRGYKREKGFDLFSSDAPYSA